MTHARQQFIERFKGTETDVLLQRLADGEPTEDAKAAICRVLGERGMPAQPLDAISADISQDEVVRHAMAIKHGPFPMCCMQGHAVGIRTSCWIGSAIVLTNRRMRRDLAGRECGARRTRRAMAFGMVLGWWGVPFGLILTPWYAGRNAMALAGYPDPPHPSQPLLALAKAHLPALPMHDVGQAANE